MSGKPQVFVRKDYKYGEKSGLLPYQSLGEALKTGLKPIPQICDGLIQAGATSLFFGAPNCGKSFVSLSLAHAVATGTDWFGHKVNQGRVLLVLGEGRQGSLLRLKALQQDQGVVVDEGRFFINQETYNLQLLDQWHEEVIESYVKDGVEPSAATELNRVKLEPVTAADEFVRHVLEIEKNTGKPINLIVLDPLQSLMGGLSRGISENSVEAFAELFNIFKRLNERPEKTAVLLIHHSGWDTTRLRGSSSLLGMAASVFKVSRQQEDIVLENIKSKDSGLISNKFFRLKTVDLGLWQPTQEDFDAYDRMDFPHPVAQRLMSAVITENSNMLDSTACFDRDKNAVSIEMVLREILRMSNFCIVNMKQFTTFNEVGVEVDKENNFDFKTFASNLDVSTAEAHAGLEATVSRGLIKKIDRKRYALTDEGIRLLRWKDGLDDIDVELQD